MAMIAGPARRRTGLDWFYELLDVEHGINIAVQDAQRCTTWQAGLFSFIINALLLITFALVWIRYDLWSTATFFMPVKDNILAVVPQADTSWASADTWQKVHWGASLALGVSSAFFTSLIQWAYPRLAQLHKAALWGLAAACIFDIATDYKDVATDFPVYVKPLLDAADKTSTGWWIAGAVACLVASFVFSGSRSLFLLFMIACVLCLFIQPSSVLFWIVVFCGTIFSSFAAQSLVLIHLAKCIALLVVTQKLRAFELA